ncbi:hypothetical protein JCM8097_002348 [Rhodosporidiobolus ruineniae]
MSEHSKDDEEHKVSTFVEPSTLKVDSKKDDVAGSFLAGIAARPDAAELLAPWTKADEKRILRWKIDPIILTLMTMMGAVDKVCIGTAAVLGMREDLGLVAQQYSWTSSVIYCGALLGVYPTLMIMQRLPAGRYMAVNCAIWGIILMASAACKNYAGLMVARFFLGLFESVIFAGSGLIVAMYWKRSEQPWRTAVKFSTLSSIMARFALPLPLARPNRSSRLQNGILSYASASYEGSLAQWRLLFILVGAVTFAWSIVTFIFLPDSPTTAWWLTMRERVIATERTKENRTGTENKTLKKSQIVEAFTDPKTYFFFAINLVLNVPNSGLTTFNSIVVASLGFSTKETMLLAIPTGVISWISSIVFAFLAVKTGKRHLCAMIACLLPLIGTVVLHVVPRSNHSGSLAGLYILYCYWGPYVTVSTLSYANTAGYTKKLAVLGFAYMGYSTGCLIGPSNPTKRPVFLYHADLLLVRTALAIALIGALWVHTIYLNRRKAEQRVKYEQEHGNAEGLVDAWHDQTDWENPKFEYII